MLFYVHVVISTSAVTEPKITVKVLHYGYYNSERNYD